MNVKEEIKELRNNLPQELIDLISKNKWNEALNKANLEEDTIILKIYLRTLTLKGNIWEKISWDKLQPLEELLLKIFSQIGFEESSNPFIKFISLYMPTNEFNKNNLILLNNLYSSYTLDYGDIAGIGINKTHHLIFNPNLYKLSNSDAEFMIKSYEWLGVESNLKTLNFSVLSYKNQSFNNDYIELSKFSKGFTNSDIFTIRDTVIYNNLGNVKKSSLHSPKDVEQFLTITSQQSKKGTKKSTKILDIINNTKGLSKEDKEEVFKQLLTNKDILNTIKKILSEV